MWFIMEGKQYFGALESVCACYGAIEITVIIIIIFLKPQLLLLLQS